MTLEGAECGIEHLGKRVRHRHNEGMGRLRRSRTYQPSRCQSGRDLLRLQTYIQSRSESVIVANPDYDKPGNPSVQIASNPETSPPTPLLQGEGSRNNLVPPFPSREGGLGGLGQLTQTRSTENQRSSEISQLQFGSLPGTAKEAAAITPMLPGVTLLTGSDATENAIKQLQSPKILHIATHGFFLNDVELVASVDFGGSTFVSNRGLGVESRPGAVPNSPPGKTENPLLRSGIALAGFLTSLSVAPDKGVWSRKQFC